MRFYLFLTAVMMCFSQMVSAVDATGKKALEIYAAGFSEINTRISQINTETAQLTAQLKTQQNELKSAENRKGQASAAEISAADTKVSEQKSKIDDLNSRISNNSQALVKLEKDSAAYRSSMDKARDSVVLANQIEAQSKVQMAAVEAQVKLTDAKVNLIGADQYVNEIERTLDREKVGIYLKDKIGKLVNSQLICEATNRCKVKAATPIGPEKLNEIFKDSKTPNRSEYYNEIRKTPEAPQAPGATGGTK